MKNKELLVIGGVAALAAGYYFFGKSKQASAATAPTVAQPTAPPAPGFTLRKYANGTKQCFTSTGNLAPLSKCGIFPPPSTPTYVLRTDPSGGKMCFHKDGTQVPLAHCERDDSLEGLSNYFPTGNSAPCCSNCASGSSCSGQSKR